MIALSIALALAAPAASPARVVVIAVTAADHADQRRLRHKIAIATEDVCGSFASVETAQWDAIESCRSDALRSVETQLAALRGSGRLRIATR